MFLVAFAVWLRVKGIDEEVDLPAVLIAILTGTIGYRVIDLHFDHRSATTAEALMGLALVREYESAILNEFGLTEANYASLASANLEYFQGEILEKSCPLARCPYSFEDIHLLARKASMVFFLFEVGLRASGEDHRVGAYREAFWRIASAVQILDDLSDLEDDLAAGYRTLPTLGFDREATCLTPLEAADCIRKSQQEMSRLYNACCNLLLEADEMLAKEGEVVLGVMCQYYLVKVHRVFQGREAFADALGIKS